MTPDMTTLPLTADGVAVLPGMVIFHWTYYGNYVKAMPVRQIGLGKVHGLDHDVRDGTIPFFSTYQLAAEWEISQLLARVQKIKEDIKKMQETPVPDSQTEDRSHA